MPVREPWFADPGAEIGDVTLAREGIEWCGAEILDACCGGRHWWWDKEHPLAVYMDERELERGAVDVRPNFEVAPDLLADFRAMPFSDESFRLVLFDPPHIVRDRPSTSYIRIKYGALAPATEQDDLRRGFAECWRVLAPGGTLVFKWGAGSIKRVEPHFPAVPIVGTRSPRGGQTRWFVFYKPEVNVSEEKHETPAPSRDGMDWMVRRAEALEAALERIAELRDSPAVPALDEGAVAREIALSVLSPTSQRSEAA